MAHRTSLSVPRGKTFFLPLLAGLAASSALTGCATIKVQAPDKPIEINLNINIKQELLVKLDREIDDLIANNPDIF